MFRRLIGQSFRAAPVRGTATNLARTALWTVVFWTVFLGLLPRIIRSLEGRAGIPTFEIAGREIAGMALFVVAGALGLWSGYTMAIRGRGTPLPLSCPRRLVVAGPYRFVRNPMAVAGIAQGLAVGVFMGSMAVILYALAGALLWDIAVRPAEEADLERRFGEDYRRYRAALRCWLPRLRPHAND